MLFYYYFIEKIDQNKPDKENLLFGFGFILFSFCSKLLCFLLQHLHVINSHLAWSKIWHWTHNKNMRHMIKRGWTNTAQYRKCLSESQKPVQAYSPVPVALVVAFSIWEDMKLTWVLYVAWTLRLILSISLMVSSLPWRISNSFQVCQKLAVTWKIEVINKSKEMMTYLHIIDGFVYMDEQS